MLLTNCGLCSLDSFVFNMIIVVFLLTLYEYDRFSIVEGKIHLIRDN